MPIVQFYTVVSEKGMIRGFRYKALCMRFANEKILAVKTRSMLYLLTIKATETEVRHVTY